MSGRDPRTHPRPGDVLRPSDGMGSFTVHVRDVDYDSLEVVYQIDGVGELLRHDIDDWQQDAQNDQVVRRAEETTP